jgi:signal transduction histidine kinase/CheY-like chemotaxis protein
LSSAGLAQQSGPIRLLVLHWYDRDYATNDSFDGAFQAALHSSTPEDIEYYSEYLETNKFPGEKQSRLLSRYLREKYADRTIDVIIAGAPLTLDFLLEHRAELFPHTPIVFGTTLPVATHAISQAGAAGFYYSRSYAKTVSLALELDPETKQLFVISGTLNHDKSVESVVRDDLQPYRNRVAITYLTDLSLEELTARVRNLPPQSIVLYAWQQLLDQRGRIIETMDILARIAPKANAPIYGKSHVQIGLGIVGGYVWTQEGMAAKLAEIMLRVVHGTRPQDIPIENAPDTPMFDWRQLQRWGIREDRLPLGSVILFRELTFWQQYKWRIVAVIVIFVLQALLIGALLVQRRRTGRAQSKLQEHEQHLEQVVQRRTAELVEARDQAQAANHAKGAFLANMSHELRTPLNAILGFTAMVRAEAELSERHRDDLALVGSSGEHLLGLIDDVLDMAKIESGGIAVVEDTLDLHRLVSDTANMLRGRAQAKNLELLLAVSSRAPQFVHSDPAKLRQVLTNLVGNAVKYTDQGSVIVRLNARPSDKSPDLVLIFDVEDTGIGIAEEDQARIFEPFVQAGGARTRKGSGLGLSISRHFVQLLGGTIRVESTLGRGSRFQVEVPARMAEASEVIAVTSGEEQVIGLDAGQPSFRILIVEDKRENWLLLQRLLQAVGFDVRVAEDGRQAVQVFELWRPHFIWMDVRLPVLSGIEAARRIRRLEGGTEVRIVAVTASAFASQRKEVLAAGMDDFLRKPYRPSEVFDCMARHLGVRYVYRAQPRAAVADEPSILRPDDLVAVPLALRDDLKAAIVSLDPRRIALLVSQISEHNTAVAAILERLAGRLAYTAIFNALKSCETEFTGTIP